MLSFRIAFFYYLSAATGSAIGLSVDKSFQIKALTFVASFTSSAGVTSNSYSSFASVALSSKYVPAATSLLPKNERITLNSVPSLTDGLITLSLRTGAFPALYVTSRTAAGSRVSLIALKMVHLLIIGALY